MNNISFIGMAGCGKSTLGNAISKQKNLRFQDTDHLIEEKFNMSLEDIKNKFGYKFVRSAEEEVILSLNESTKIISTGGEGGMISTNNEEFYKKIWSFKDHGKSLDKILQQIMGY